MLTILDIGCRYGVFPLFAKTYEKFEYVGVDADRGEILRLEKKYENKKIEFHSAFLGKECGEVELNVGHHKGYNSSKHMNENSLWFSRIRAGESGVEEKKTVTAYRSGDWIADTIKADNKLIVKLDIEGSELDFLKGLNPGSFDRIEAFIVEAHFDGPYLSESSFSSISSFLAAKGYWLVSLDLEKGSISKYCEPADQIPLCSTAIFLKSGYKPVPANKQTLPAEHTCDVLFALKLEGLLFESLLRIKYPELKSFRLFEDYKFMIGHKFNRLKKSPYFDVEELASNFELIFGEKLPLVSDFYQSDFFNPV